MSLDVVYDTDETASCHITYKKTAETAWLEGLPADRITIQGEHQFRGSLFLLEENTSYDVQVTLVDSFPTHVVQTLPVQSVSTLSNPSFLQAGEVKWVSPTGSGTVYSESQPGNIKALLSSGTVHCGTTVVLKDGSYTDLNLALTLTSDCDLASPIQFLAAPGAHPVFDGGYSDPLVWTPHASDPKLFSAALPAGTDFSNLCLLNGQMLYPYPSLTANILFGNYNLVDLNLDDDGFVRDNQVIWLKTKAGINPNLSDVVLSKTFRFLTVYGNNKKAFLKFQGITVKNIAKSTVSGVDGFGAVALDLRKLSQVTFDHCNFEYNNSNILFTGKCDDILVQNCFFKNGNGLWSHAETKKSNLNTVFVPTSMARGGETGALEFSEGKAIVVRNNRFEGVNSGIVGYFDTALMEEVDVSNNTFADNFDAIECDGNWSNLRVWGNEIISPMAAFSLAPPLIGPRYYYRNTIHHLKGRHNEEDDPYFIGCTPVSEYNSQAIGLKTNSGVSTSPEAGNVYLINNTIHSDDTLGFSYTLWDREWKHLSSINNIFYGSNNHVGYFQGFLGKSNFQLASSHDNYFCANPSTAIFLIKEIHGQYTCHEVPFVSDIEAELTNITGSNHIGFEQPFQLEPAFLSSNEGGFSLAANSPLIDIGVQVPGFYDFLGSNPDLGAKETAVVSDIREENTATLIRIYPNPSAGSTTIDFGKLVAEASITLYNACGQRQQTLIVRQKAQQTLDLPDVPGIYFASVQMGATTRFYKISRL